MRKWLAFLFLACAPALGVQTAYPIADVTSNCTGTYANVDETTSGDSSYEFCSVTISECGSESIGQTWTLGSLTDPLSSTGHTIRVKCSIVDAPWGVTVGLLQGGVFKGSISVSCDGAEEAVTFSAAVADSITNYADLEVFAQIAGNDLDCTCGGGCPHSINVEYIRFEVPDAGGAAPRRIFIIE